ncbi:MAG: hypothetical protein HYT15_05100 [Candidatus Magasanikbacteria bacterium]|nr:hypothetical protein [Candidatus Magasanikbacteria bacterium]
MTDYHTDDDPELFGLEIAGLLACFADTGTLPSLEDEGAEITISEFSDADLFNWEVEHAVDTAVVVPEPAGLKAATAEPTSVDDGWEMENPGDTEENTQVDRPRHMIITAEGPRLVHHE